MLVRLIGITESHLGRILAGVHNDNGYITVSAYRSWAAENPEESAKRLPTEEETEEQQVINIGNDTELRRILRTTYAFSYLPVHGGFIETTDDGRKIEVTEPAYIVFASDRTGRPAKMEDLKAFGRELAARFNQDSILVKEPGAKGASFMNREGGTDVEFQDFVTNRTDNPYFTKLRGGSDRPLKPGRTPKSDSRYSWTNVKEYQVVKVPADVKRCFFIHESPKSLVEAHVRGGNEIFLRLTE